jgi:hypothetical protein
LVSSLRPPTGSRNSKPEVRSRTKRDKRKFNLIGLRNQGRFSRTQGRKTLRSAERHQCTLEQAVVKPRFSRLQNPWTARRGFVRASKVQFRTVFCPQCGCKSTANVLTLLRKPLLPSQLRLSYTRTPAPTPPPIPHSITRHSSRARPRGV